MSLLSNKKVLIIGDRDGIPGPAIEECVKTVEGAEVVFIYRMLCLNSCWGYGLRKSKQS